MFILNTASPWIIPERSTAPQHARFILPPIHPTKSSLRCVGSIFLLWVTHLENFMIRPDVIPTFQPTPLHKQGQELRSEQTVTPIHEQSPATYFCALTIRKHLLNLSGRGPSICYRRPFCRLKAPLGLSLLRCAAQTRACLWQAEQAHHANNEKQEVPTCWVSVKQFSKNDTATACQDWLRITRLGRGSIKSHVRTVKVLGMGLFAFQERVHLWKGVTH